MKTKSIMTVPVAWATARKQPVRIVVIEFSSPHGAGRDRATKVPGRAARLAGSDCRELSSAELHSQIVIA